MNRFYPKVSARALNRCEYCRAPEIVFNMPFEIDHIIPQARGGTNVMSNLALSCSICNLFKSDHLTSYDIETQLQMQLFNPRKNVWIQNFSIDLETAEVVGITPRGRATVTCLQMNRTHQISARRSWIALDMFP